MAWLPDPPAVEAATFKVLEGPGASQPAFAVQFNPASLDYTISNEFDNRNDNNGARQFVKKSSAKLTMTLVFDTTSTGGSVRDVTASIAALLEPAPDGSKQFAPKVEFGWGTYSFKGVVEQFKETLDFFSASGVPLRSSIALTLASQSVEFQSNRSPSPSADRNTRPDPVQLPLGTSAADAAARLGDPRAARAIAHLSGAASLRLGGDVSLSVGGEIGIGAPVAFSVGASVGATAGTAFAGLRSAPPAATVSIGDARAALLPGPRIAGAATFGPGGRAQVQAGGSLAADVGSGLILGGRIGFGD